MGAITAIGNNVAENRASLQVGFCGIKKDNTFESKYAGILPFALANISSTALKEKFSISLPGVTRTSLLALHAFEEALQQSGLSPTQLSSHRTAFINASTVGGMCLTDNLYRDANRSEKASPFLTSYHCASVANFLQKKYQLQGIVNTINTACSSSANAIMYGASLICNGFADRAIVGGVDSLAKFTINGFNALHILSPEICRPFDAARQGLNLGEGAAFLVLEKEADCSDKKRYARLSGYCNSNDAFHPSSLSANGDGPFLAMTGALQLANISATEIGFINTHGTGTENNDEVESRAMQRVFIDVPAFASTKSNTGHTLGAAGAVEAVYSILNLFHQEAYTSLHCSEPIAATGLQPLTRYQPMKLQHVMSNSFGFGGNCSSLIFSTI